MASGKPDWNRIVTVQGKYNDEWLPMKVDATGQLYIAMVAQEIDVTQLDSDRNIMGDDGGEKRYVAVDPNGVMMARLKGLFGAGLIDIAVDANGIMLSRIKGSFGGAMKDVAVDTDGNLLSVMKGLDGATLRTVYVDATGKMVARIQGATGGDLVVYVLDDCGDSDLVSNWSPAIDGLDSEESTTFVKEGSISMKLGVDASLNGLDYATWVNQQTKGDLTGLTADKVKIWVWISTVDYLLAAGTALKYGIGSGIGDFYYFDFTKDDLTQGWNELICDLSSPTGSIGTPLWSAIDVQFFDIYEIVANTDDFYIVVDSIIVVRDNPDPGTLKDLNTDANGFLLAKMVGSFGDYLKPLSVDRYGNQRTNLTKQEIYPLVTGRSRGNLQKEYLQRNHPAAEEYTMCDIAGPGMINTFAVTHSGAVAQGNCRLIVTIDGTEIEPKSITTLKRYALTIPDCFIPYLQAHEVDGFRYAFGIRSGTYFHTQLKIVFDENTGAASTELHLSYTVF